MKRAKTPLILAVALILLIQPLLAQDAFLPAKARDISDRAYEPAVIELIDNAKESIAISMYSISVGRAERNPVRFLLGDLLEARKRGVDVTIHLNTRFSFSNVRKYSEKLLTSPMFHDLKEAGCNIYFVPSKYRLHDKLIIVDSRYVVEGSMNWSTSALKANFESSTLIDSPELAKIKLLRLKTIPLSVEIKKPPNPSYITELPENITLPVSFVTGENTLSRFISHNDNRSLGLYLLLLAYSQKKNEKEFFVDLEDMALSLGMVIKTIPGEVRRPIRDNLVKLKNRYALLNEVKLFHAIDAWIRLSSVPGDTFTVPTGFIRHNAEKELTTRLKTIIIIRAYLRSQGEDIANIPTRELSRRFDIHRAVLAQALKELKKMENTQ